MTHTMTAPPIEGYVVGIWKIDPTHSEVSWTIRHTLVHLRGRFVDLSGVIVTQDDLLKSHVQVRIDPRSFWSGSPVRDEKIRTLPDFLDADRWPDITFRSEGIELKGDDHNFRLNGILECRGVERHVALDARFNGFGRCDLYGLRMGFSARATLDRRDFGMDTSPPTIAATRALEDGDSMLGWTLNVDIQVEAVLQGDEGRYRW